METACRAGVVGEAAHREAPFRAGGDEFYSRHSWISSPPVIEARHLGKAVLASGGRIVPGKAVNDIER